MQLQHFKLIVVCPKYVKNDVMEVGVRNSPPYEKLNQFHSARLLILLLLIRLRYVTENSELQVK